MNVNLNVQNFGPIEKAEIDLRPLTIFVGESNTGKTYLAALIYALHKHFGGFSHFPGSEAIAAEFRSMYRRLYNSSKDRQKIETELLEVLEKLNTPGRPFRVSDLPQQVYTNSQRRITNKSRFEGELERCFDLESVSKLIRFTDNSNGKMRVSLGVQNENGTCWDFAARDAGRGLITEGRINPDMTLLDARHRRKVSEISDIERLFRYLHSYQLRGRDSYYLPAARSGIMQSRDVLAAALIKRATRIGLDHFEVSTFSGIIADFMEQLYLYKERKGSSTKIRQVAEQLETDLLGGKIEVKYASSEAYPEFLYRPEQAKESLRMSRASAMVSELGPLVLFLRGIVKRGNLLIIEEPESHLHPGAQTKIAQTLARLIRAGVRVIITTHSSWLLEQIGNLIREGELRKEGESTAETEDWLKKEEVGAWLFHKDTPVTQLRFGLVEGIEPEDYLDIAEDLYNRSAGLQNRIEEAKRGYTVESE